MVLRIDDTLRKYNEGHDRKENANSTVDTLSKRDTFIVNEFHKAHGLSIAVAADAHTKGELQIHDLGGGMDRPYCCGHNLSTLLHEGLGIPGYVSSRPAKHLDTVVSHMIELLQICSNEFAGAQAFSRVNTLLAPYVKARGLSYAQVRQQMQQLVYHLNYPSRQSFQTPFSNLSFDWGVPSDLRHDTPLIAGEECEFTYGDCQHEADMIIAAFLDVLAEGDSNGKPFTFPIPTFGIEDGDVFGVHSDKHRKLWELTAKFGSPYFMNYLGSGIDPSSKRSMCCRLSLDLDEIADATGGVWDIGEGTGSIAITSINLNRCALNGGTVDGYFDELERLYWLAVRQCVQRKDHIFDAYRLGRLPYTKKYTGNGSPDPDVCFKSFFLTVGIVGAYEAWVNLGMDDDIYRYTDFCIDTMNLLKELQKKARDETGWKLWNIEQTPAEGCAPRFAALDRKYFPDCYVSGSGDDGYLTNSTHLPVDSSTRTSEQIAHRSVTDRMYSGGTLLNWYTDEAASAESVMNLVKNLCYNTQLPYIAYTPTVAVCGCGRTVYASQGDTCPDCGSHVKFFSRVVGYIRPVDQFNDGQKAQCMNRRYMYAGI